MEINQGLFPKQIGIGEILNMHPTTLAEIQALVDSQESESLHLEFKSSTALTNGKHDEISKDISAFANSDGGLIIYGIVEASHVAQHIDEGLSNDKRNHKEWLENKVTSNVSPKLPGLRISEIELENGNFIYAMSVPASDRGPHQDRPSHRYYKRHNFKCEPMEDYEIRDVRNRVKVLPPLLSVRIDVVQGSMLQFCVENIGDLAASDVTFTFSTPLKWKHVEPKALSEGIKVLPPHRRLAFFYGSGIQLGSGELVQHFSVDASYFHPTAGKRLTEQFEIDLESLMHTLNEYTDLERHAQTLEKTLKETTRSLEKIAKSLSHLETIAGPSGLDFSYSTRKTLYEIMGAAPSVMRRLDPRRCTWELFQEILDLDENMAIRLKGFFAWPKEEKLSSLEGMTDKLFKNLQTHFDIESYVDN